LPKLTKVGTATKRITDSLYLSHPLGDWVQVKCISDYDTGHTTVVKVVKTGPDVEGAHFDGTCCVLVPVAALQSIKAKPIGDSYFENGDLAYVRATNVICLVERVEPGTDINTINNRMEADDPSLP